MRHVHQCPECHRVVPCDLLTDVEAELLNKAAILCWEQSGRAGEVQLIAPACSVDAWDDEDGQDFWCGAVDVCERCDRLHTIAATPDADAFIEHHDDGAT